MFRVSTGVRKSHRHEAVTAIQHFTVTDLSTGAVVSHQEQLRELPSDAAYAEAEAEMAGYCSDFAGHCADSGLPIPTLAERTVMVFDSISPEHVAELHAKLGVDGDLQMPEPRVEQAPDAPNEEATNPEA